MGCYNGFAMKAVIRRIGNSRGIIIPKPLISQLDLSGEVELDLEGDAIILRRPRKRVRSGWAKASKELAARGDHKAVWTTFANRGDKKLRW